MDSPWSIRPTSHEGVFGDPARCSCVHFFKICKKYSGLVNVSGFHVDPGFIGKLIFAVYNAGPTKICIAEGDKLFLIWFANLDKSDTKYNRIEGKKAPQTGISSTLVQELRGQEISLPALAAEVRSIQTFVTIVKSVVAAGGILLALFFASLQVPWGHFYGNRSPTAQISAAASAQQESIIRPVNPPAQNKPSTQ